MGYFVICDQGQIPMKRSPVCKEHSVFKSLLGGVSVFMTGEGS